MDLIEFTVPDPSETSHLYATIFRCTVTGKSRLDFLNFLAQGSPKDLTKLYHRELKDELIAWGCLKEECQKWFGELKVVKEKLRVLYNKSSEEIWEYLWENEISIPPMDLKRAVKVVRRQLRRHFLEFEEQDLVPLLISSEEPLRVTYSLRLSPIYHLELTAPPGFEFTKDPEVLETFENLVGTQLLLSRLTKGLLGINTLPSNPEWISQDMAEILEKSSTAEEILSGLNNLLKDSSRQDHQVVTELRNSILTLTES